MRDLYTSGCCGIFQGSRFRARRRYDDRVQKYLNVLASKPPASRATPTPEHAPPLQARIINVTDVPTPPRLPRQRQHVRKRQVKAARRHKLATLYKQVASFQDIDTILEQEANEIDIAIKM